MKTNFVTIFIMCGSKGEARRISDSLLKKRLIACANIISRVESKFWWKGKIDSAKEFSLILKTKAKNFKKIEKEIRRIHSYEVPEIIAVPIAAGSRDYLDWIKNTLS